MSSPSKPTSKQAYPTGCNNCGKIGVPLRNKVGFFLCRDCNKEAVDSKQQSFKPKE